MSVRGQKPKPTVLRLLTGNAGKRPLPPPDPVPAGTIARPAKLRGAPGKLWDTFIAKCFWLTWADSPKAAMWCHLQAEFDSGPRKMVAARIAQLRALGSELGFDQASRTRIGLMGELGNPNVRPTAKPAPPDRQRVEVLQMMGGHRGRKLLQAQRSHGLPPLGPPPSNLNGEAVRAWRDIVEASPAVLLAMNELIVSIAATTLSRWRSGGREPGLLRLTYRCLGDLFIPMLARRRLMFPDRPPRR